MKRHLLYALGIATTVVVLTWIIMHGAKASLRMHDEECVRRFSLARTARDTLDVVMLSDRIGGEHCYLQRYQP